MLRRWRDVWGRFKGRGVYPHELAFLLDTRLRRLVLTPEALTDRLALAPGMRVLEIGPGPGYFSVEIARRLEGGLLVLADVQREMLAKARRKLEGAGIAHPACVQADAAALPLRESTFDVVVLVTVLGEVTRRDACLREIARVLRRGGVLSVTEQRGDPDALSREELIEQTAMHGFALCGEFVQGRGFTMNFETTSFAQAPPSPNSPERG